MLKLNFMLRKSSSSLFKKTFLNGNINNFPLLLNGLSHHTPKFYFAEGEGKSQKGGENKKEKPAKQGRQDKSQENPQPASQPKIGEKEVTKKKESMKKKYDEDDEEEERVNIGSIDINKMLGRKPPLKAEKYEISHNYEKGGKAPTNTKKVLENLVTQMLRNEGVTNVEAKEFKKEIRDPLNHAYGRHLNKIQSRADAEEYIKTWSDLYFYKRTFDSFQRLIKFQSEIRDQSNPAYIQLRSQHKLVYKENMTYLTPENTDVRQNVNSKDWLKIQPRFTSINYSYNIEGHKEFHNKYATFVAEDKKRVQEKQKLLKYIKLNPNDQQVKERFIPTMLPDGVTPNMIPEYAVDVAGYKPEVTKKSRRKYKTPKVDTNFKNYEAWRCFDRPFHAFNHEMDFLKVDLVPQNLINRFGYPCTPMDPNFTGIYYFEDENLDLFLVGDFMQTQESHGPNYVDEFYEEQEVSVKPEWRVQKHPSLDEFWSSTERKEFRIYFLRYSENKKFKRWLKVYVNYFNPETDKTMDQILDEKFGKLDDYTDYNLNRVNKEVPAIYHYYPKYFMDKNDKSIVEHDPFVPPKYISPEDGELFDYEEMMREEARKAAKGGKVDKEEEMKSIGEIFSNS